MIRNLRNSEDGVTLLELMLVLAVIALIIAIALRFFGATTRSKDLTEASQGVMFIAQAVHQWRGPQADYSGLSNSVVTVPSNFSGAGTANVKLPVWSGCSSGTLTLAPGTTVVGARPTFVITYSNIDPTLCQALAKHYQQQSPTDDVVATNGSCSGTGTCAGVFTTTLY